MIWSVRLACGEKLVLESRVPNQSISAPGLPPSRFNEILVGLAVMVSAGTAIMLTRVPGGIALFWPANAIAGALLIRLPQVRWRSASACVAIALMLANMLVAQRPWHTAALFTIVNVVEIALMVGAFRFMLRFPYPDITIEQAAVMTAGFGIAIPGLATLLGCAVLHIVYGTSWVEGSLQWWSSHAIGACLVGPPIILFSVKGFKRLSGGRFIAQNALAVILCLIGCYVAIRFVRFPFVSIGLILMIAAFRLGGFGASLMSLSVGLLITNLWILGIRPIGLDPARSIAGSMIGLPVLALLATVMPSIAVGLGSDARRAAARALKVSERRFRESMKYSPIGMLIADLNGIWGYTNLALQQMLGYSAEELRAMPPGGPSKPDDWKQSQSRWGQLLTGEIEFYDTVRCFQHKAGHWVWTHVAVSLLRDEDGTPLHLIAQLESLEARRRSEEKLAAERERLTTTLQSISDAVITTDADSVINYINRAAERLLGLDLSAVEGRRVQEVVYLMDPKSSKAAANLIAQSALHAKAIRREQPCLLHRPDGTICYVTDSVSPVLDSTGTLTGMVIVFRDATLDIERARDLRQRATYDALTGLTNRAEFDERLRAAFAKAQHLTRPAALLAIDLDRFKAVNDAAGHAAGDAVLCKVAEVCRALVRSSDTIARLGGDEFAVLIENCTQESAAFLARKILRALNPLEIVWEGSHYAVGASIGLAMSTLPLADEKAWLAAADKACFIAKREGRGRLTDAPCMDGEMPIARTLV
jgi:diguanylate cyclase (GGDEF)-like protein/PAS domain S-box-containing protein